MHHVIHIPGVSVPTYAGDPFKKLKSFEGLSLEELWRKVSVRRRKHAVNSVNSE